jgi:hypothetical protein
MQEHGKGWHGKVVRLPRPGELKNRSYVPMGDEELARLLMASARDWGRGHCDPFECETCNNFLLAWWDGCNGLSQAWRVGLQSSLRVQGVALPDAPWEDEEPQ